MLKSENGTEKIGLSPENYDKTVTFFAKYQNLLTIWNGRYTVKTI